MFAVGCSDIMVGIGKKPSKPEESVFTVNGDGNYTVKAKGGDVVVKVTTNLEYNVIIPDEASWLSLAESRAVREESLTFSVEENEELEQRSAVISIVDAEGKELDSITITQEGAEPVFTTDGEGNYIVKAEGGDVVVKITTNLQYDVIIPDEASWLSLAESRAVREESLNFIVEKNQELEERSVLVELKGADSEVLQRITIKQEGADPMFKSNAESEYWVEAKGGEVLIEVTTNLQYDIVIEDDASWVTLADTRAVREETLRFKASENEELEERSAVVDLKSVDGELLQSFTIKQKGADPVFTTDGENNYIVKAEGGEIELKVTTNMVYDVVADAEWLNIADTRAMREESIIVSVAKNEEFKERSAAILLTSSKGATLQEITITQESDAANVPDNQIWYLATSRIEPSVEAVFGANILSNDFADGKGVITFDGAVKSVTNQAFAKIEALAMIALPKSVESVEEGCFAECSNLEKFVSSFATLDNRALVVDEVMVAFAPKGLTSYTTPREAKRIGEYTFAYCMELVKVTVDYDTEVIGAWAFTHCEELVNAHIADSVNTIEAGAFSYCYKLGMSGAYTVEDGFIMRGGTIVGSTGSGGSGGSGGGAGGGGGGGAGGGGGYGGSGTLTIPSKVTTIAAEAFKNYDGINEVVIPESVTEIYAWAFIGCRSLERVVCLPTVPPTAVFVDEVWDAFDGQHDNRKIYVPRNSVKAYREAEGWREYAEDIVSIDGIDPDTPETYMINYTATAKVVPSSDDFDVNIVANVWDENTGEGIICFDGELTELGYSAFYAEDALLTIELPNSVTTLQNQVFGYCSNLKTVTLGTKVKSLGGYLFTGCTSLESVVLPNSLTTIGDGAFSNCQSLQSINIPNSVTSMGTAVFSYCNSLKEFTGKYATDYGRLLVVNSSLYAFAYGCGKTEYTIPGGISSIGKGAFYGCNTIERVTIQSQVTAIGEWAFRSCENLKSISIAEGVKSIGTYAFQSCTSLESITLPSTIKSIKDCAFNACDNLVSIYCKATTPPTGAFAMFLRNAPEGKIYVPYSSVDKYREASYWSDYKEDIVAYDFEKDEIYDPNVGEDTKIYYTATSKIEPYYTGVGVFGAEIVSNEWDATTGEGVICFDDEVTILGDNAFYQRANLKSITIPESVVSVSAKAFQMSGLQEFKGKFASEDGCCVVIDGVLVAFAPKSTTSYTIPADVVEIGDNAFGYCWSVESVTIPQSVKRIGNYAFYDCGALSDVLIAEGVESIGDTAFASCDVLESVTIPNSVTTVGASLFISCENLASVEIGAGITRLENRMFDSCYMLADVTIPESVTSIGKEVFMNCKSLESITLPSSIVSVGESAFYSCENLKSVYCEPTTPPAVVYNWSWSAFGGNAEDRKIYVPAESIDAYKSAEGWSEYADAIVGYNFTTGEIVLPRPNVASAEELQAALDGAIEGDNIITFVSDIVGPVIISQQEGKNIIIDGAGYQFDGTMYIHGNSRYNGAETLLIHNVDFQTSSNSLDFISQSYINGADVNYPHNITFENCTFAGGSVVVGLRLRQAKNVLIKSCRMEGGHSLAQLAACNNVVFDGVELTASRVVSLGSSTDVVINNCSFEATSYGLRAEPNGNLVVNNSTIKASQPIIVHKLNAGSYSVDLSGVNTLIPTVDGDYQVVFTNGDYRDTYVEPLGEWSITGAEGYKIFPEAEVADERAVDLGLSVKWASCNVGANAPEECGDYFAWGEIAPKEVYTLDNCLTNGLKLDDISGNPQYDAAAANWGGDWRVPTIAEFQELIDNCTWESVCLNDMQGMQVTGPNGNSIFLPAAGTCPNGSPTSVGVRGYYWSSTPYEEGKTSAYAINFLGEYYNSYWIGRYNSLSIRPVID